MIKCELHSGSDIKCPHCFNMYDAYWTIKSEYRIPKKISNVICPNCQKTLDVEIKVSYSASKNDYVKHSTSSQYIIVAKSNSPYSVFKQYYDGKTHYLVIGKDNGWVSLEKRSKDSDPLVFNNLQEATEYDRARDEHVYEVELDMSLNVTKWIKLFDK